MFHGGNLSQASIDYNIPSKDWLDLSTGINRQPYPVDNVPSELWHRLPYPSELKSLEDAARHYYQVPEHADIVAAPGSSALIAALPALTFNASFASSVIIAKQSYQEHLASWKNAGSKIKLIEEQNILTAGYPIKTDSTIAVAEKSPPLIQVIVNPNNPTGRLYNPETLLEHKKRLGHKGLLIVDEAFMDCTPEHSLSPKSGEKGLVILRSFGKFFGLAGLRLGFAIGHPDDITLLRDQIGAWPISGVALLIGRKAFQDQLWIEQTNKQLEKDSHALNHLLKQHNFTSVGSTNLFSLVSNDNMKKIQQKLAHHAIWTRRFAYEKKWLRIGLPRNPHDFKRLETALKHL